MKTFDELWAEVESELGGIDGLPHTDVLKEFCRQLHAAAAAQAKQLAANFEASRAELEKFLRSREP